MFRVGRQGCVLLRWVIDARCHQVAALSTSHDPPHAEDSFGTLDRKHVKRVQKIHKKRARFTNKQQNLDESSTFDRASTDYRAIHDEQQEPQIIPKREQSYVDTNMSQGQRRRRGAKQTPGGHVGSGGPAGMVSTQEDWADTFGTLDQAEVDKQTHSTAEYDEDTDDEATHRRLRSHSGPHTAFWYHRKCQRLAKKGMIYEAVEMLEKQMIEEDRVQPESDNFTVVIGALGRVGYTKKAFQLFSKMKKMGVQPDEATYTALFNACSNSPWREDGLRRMIELRRHLQDKDITPNLTTYKAMIKAYGKWGELQTAFSLADDLLDQGYRADSEVFSHLLIACISDRSSGLKHAIEVWRRMRKRRVRPTTGMYNLLLRAVRDCRLGDLDLANQLLGKRGSPDEQFAASRGSQPKPQMKHEELPPSPTTPMLDIDPVSHADIPHIETNVEDSASLADTKDSYTAIMDEHAAIIRDGMEVTSQTSHSMDEAIRDDMNVSQTSHSENSGRASVQLSSPASADVAVVQQREALPAPLGPSIMDMTVPNILNPRFRDADIIGLADLQKPWQRLGLLGGVPGLLTHMAHDKAKPDIKTFTQLLDIIPSTAASEFDLLSVMYAQWVKPDVDFYNALIRKRNLRKDYEGAKEVLNMIKSKKLSPNVQTYGCLAMGCYSRHDGIQLLDSLKEQGLQPSSVTCQILIRLSDQDFTYKLYILQRMAAMNVLPTTWLIRHIEDQIQQARQGIVQKEKGESVDRIYHNKYFKDNFRKFMAFYNKWLDKTDMDLDEDPWASYSRPHWTTLHKEHQANANQNEHQPDANQRQTKQR